MKETNYNITHKRGSGGGDSGLDPLQPPLPPLNTRKAIGCLAILTPDSLKKKLPSQHSMLGHHRPAPAKRHLVVF